MSTFTEDISMMARALELARRGLYTTDPNPRVGCVIVKGGNIIGEGWHQRAGEPHAEIMAINACNDKTQLAGATVYVTLEPCSHHGKTPPCATALVEAAVGRVVIAMSDPNPEVGGKGIAALRDAGIPLAVGLMESEAKAINPGFVCRMQRQRPYIRVKLAASLDGRTALDNGESKWITEAAARDDVQRWRARSSAVLTGISTVLHDDPSLNVRLKDAERQPLRIVLDSKLRMPATARMLSLSGDTLVITTEVVTTNEQHKRAQKLRNAGAELLFISQSPTMVYLEQLMEQLAIREINELHVEAGATLCGVLLRAKLVDELVLYLAPHLMGASARGMFNFPALESMAERIKLDIQDVRAVGRDWRFICRIEHN